MTKKYQDLIKKGVSEPMHKVPFHKKAPIKRFSMLSKKIIPQSDMHIAVHFVDATKKLSEYSSPHKHNKDEINLILSEDSNLKYRIDLEDETYTVTSPCTIFIPKGLTHTAQAISGKGTFVCIILSNDYSSK